MAKLLVLLICAVCVVDLTVASSCQSIILKRGSRGECVKELQRKLGGLSVDGIFGSGTERAVKQFQSSKGLVADGIVGPNTWNALLGGSATSASGPISSNCLACICQIESNCRPLQCSWDVNSLSCGYYQIKHAYYKDCTYNLNAPVQEWQDCALDKTCATNCVKKYMSRYSGRFSQTCETYSRLHNGGPNGPNYSGTAGYWSKVQGCCIGKGGC